jgi:regulator of replication initiation timing
MAVDPAMDSEAILAIVAPMLEEKIAEVLQVIADLKNELSESVEDAPAEEVELQLSAHQRFSNIVKFLK